MPAALINGISLYYEIHGAGPPVVLAHGGGSNHLTWYAQVYELMRNYKVITFDHRGFGHSSTDARGPAEHVNDLAGLLDHLQIRRAALIGQSLGGFTCAGFASRHPDRVTVLVLASGPVGLVALPPGGHSATAAAAAAAAKTNDEWIDNQREREAQRGGFSRRDPKGSFLFECIGRLNYKLDPRSMGEVGKFRFDPQPIATAAIPTLLMAGAEDKSNCEVMKNSVLPLLPGARLEMVADTAHHLFFEKPDETNRLLLDFLRQHADRL